MILDGKHNCYQSLSIIHVDVSWTESTPKWLVYSGKSHKMDDLGVPPFCETHMFFITSSICLHPSRLQNFLVARPAYSHHALYDLPLRLVMTAHGRVSSKKCLDYQPEMGICQNSWANMIDIYIYYII